MNIQVSGTRDGADWPAPGETVDVSAVEAEELVANGVAEAVEQPKKTGK